jgi:hypothetical protein
LACLSNKIKKQKKVFGFEGSSQSGLFSQKNSHTWQNRLNKLFTALPSYLKCFVSSRSTFVYFKRDWIKRVCLQIRANFNGDSQVFILMKISMSNQENKTGMLNWKLKYLFQLRRNLPILWSNIGPPTKNKNMVDQSNGISHHLDFFYPKVYLFAWRPSVFCCDIFLGLNHWNALKSFGDNNKCQESEVTPANNFFLLTTVCK